MEAITEKITQDQTAQLTKFVDDVIRKLGLSKDEAQELIKKFNLVKPELEAVFKKYSIADQRFGPAITEFELAVPADYKHDTRIDTFRAKVKKEKTTYYYNDSLTSENFAKATTTLEPGRKFKVKIFPILETVTSEDCMNFLKTQNAVLVGAQGMTLAYDVAKDQLPKGKWTVSFDEKNSLWKDSGGLHRVPYVDAYSDGAFEFYLGRFERDWHSGHCLFCFCDL